MSTTTNTGMDAETVREKVREGYGRIASKPSTDGGSCCGPSCCGGTAGVSADDIAASAGYSKRELEELPDGANMGLSCGNPTALASLKIGEVVLDLGSGGGFDVYLAGPRVGGGGQEGRVIGVDMTPEMVTRARRSIPAYRAKTGLNNVEFRLGEIENLPVPDASVDVVISNCVINLSPDKERVWREIARVLKPGGRVAVSDLALVRPLPEQVRNSVEALVGCIAGAVLSEETERMARGAGLVDIRLERKNEYIDRTAGDYQDPLYREIAEELEPEAKMSDYVTSLYVTARKAATD